MGRGPCAWGEGGVRSSGDGSGCGCVAAGRVAPVRAACGCSFAPNRGALDLRPSAGERLYHVFYHLVAGASAAERSQLSLHGSSADYACMRGRAPPAHEMSAHSAALRRVRAALQAFCSQSQALAALRLVSAVMLLSNLAFRHASRAAGGSDDEWVVDEGALELAARQLQLPPAELRGALSAHTLELRGEAIEVRHSVQQAEQMRDGLATVAYCRLFDWLCASINGSMRRPALEGADPPRTPEPRTPEPRTPRAAPRGEERCIGVLDLFGFETFGTNSLEQLLINYANEKLQAQFVAVVLRLEEAEYERERLSWVPIGHGQHSDATLRLIEDPMGVLSLLDEQAAAARAPARTR